MSITMDNMMECLNFGERWCDEHMAEDPSLLCEKYAIQEAFLSFEQLELRGGAIRFDGKIQAFSFGKKSLAIKICPSETSFSLCPSLTLVTRSNMLKAFLLKCLTIKMMELLQLNSG